MEGTEEAKAEITDDSKDLQQQSKAFDKLTDRVEDRQLDSDRGQSAMASIAASREADLNAKRLSHKPEILWAQNSATVYLTVVLPGAKEISVNCSPQGLFTFHALGAQGKLFEFSLELYGKILPEYKKNVSRSIIFSIQKDERSWWPRLLRSGEKPAPHIKVDWDNWCDEDEDDEVNSKSSDGICMADLSLPYDLHEPILLHLPVQILLGFKLMCKEWCELISSTSFIHKQVELSASPGFFLVIDDPESQVDHPFAHLIDPSTQALSSLPIPAMLVSRWVISTMVHCDGLFLCRCCSPSTEFGPYTAALWNPALGKVAWFTRVSSAYNVYGIGYSNNNPDVYKYKILRFADSKDIEKSLPRVQIFDYALGSWRTIEATSGWYCYDSVSVKGKMYWIARLWSFGSDFFILSFDFSKEEFSDLCNLPFNSVANGATFGLSSFRGDRLSCLCQCNNTVEVEVWVTNFLDEEVVSWSRYVTVLDPSLPVLRVSIETGKPVHYIDERNGRVVVWCEEEGIEDGQNSDVLDSVYELSVDGIVSKFEASRRERHYSVFLCDFCPGYKYVPSLVPVPIIEED